MADWNQPLLSTAHASFLSIMKDRDFDAGSSFLNAPTNPITGMFRYVRATNKFQEYDGALWVDKLIALEGGGTGAATAANARTNLGLGSLATQAASAVNITGGVISGLSSFQVAGNITAGGQLITGSATIVLTNAAGRIPALTSDYFASLVATQLTGYVAANMAAGSTFPAISGVNLTALNASAIASGLLHVDRMGSGSSGTKFLRGDNTWQEVSVVKSVQLVEATVTYSGLGDTENIAITALTDYTKAVIINAPTHADDPGQGFVLRLTSNTNMELFCPGQTGGASRTVRIKTYIVEYKNVG